MENIYQRDLHSTLGDNQYIGLWRLMEGYRSLYLIATICIGIAATSRSGTYLLLGFFIDNILHQNNSTIELPLIAIGFVALAIITGTTTFISGSLSAKTSEAIAKRLRDYLFDHIQRLSFTYHDQTKTGELIQRSTSDVDAVRRFFAEQAIGVGRIFLLFSVNLTFLLILNWQLALYSIIVIPITVALSVFFFKRVSKAYEAFQEQDAILSNRLLENLTGVRVVKAFSRQIFEMERFEIDNWEKYLRGKRLLQMHSLYWPISDILTGGQMLAGFTIGAIFAINGTISIGNYLSYAGLVIWIIWPIRNMGRLIVQMSSGWVSFRRVMEIIKKEQEPLDEGDYLPLADFNGEIKFKHVSFEYEKDSRILNDINFYCKAGQTVALLGSTGSGKTSIANLLPRFYEYTKGSITIDGVELNRIPRDFLRSQIGIVEQEPILFSRTIKENITYGVKGNIPDKTIIGISQIAGIHDDIVNFPNGYNTFVGEKGVTLSGGQKQRVAIARTLLKDPSILIFDDATSSIDVETESKIRKALLSLMKKRTTFIIAHRIQSVMDADLILILDKGEIKQMGTHEDLLSEEGIYQKIFKIQTQIGHLDEDR